MQNNRAKILDKHKKWLNLLYENMQLTIVEDIGCGCLSIQKGSKKSRTTDKQSGTRNNKCAIPDLFCMMSFPIDPRLNHPYGSQVSRTFKDTNKKSATMKSRNLLSCTTFRSGELYLFHRSDRTCSSAGTLFGIVDRTHVGVVYLESSSEDMCRFRLWHRLPGSYRYSRRATRAELRDYMFNLACYECRETRIGL